LKNNDYGKMEKDQLKEEIQKLRIALQSSEEQKEYLKSSSATKIANL
jgi:hypothetical protein